jgi:hypothetical protein
MAAAVVSVHNHVLRRWLRGDSSDPAGEVNAAMREVIALFPVRTPVTAAASRAERHEHGLCLPYREDKDSPTCEGAAQRHRREARHDPDS